MKRLFLFILAMLPLCACSAQNVPEQGSETAVSTVWTTPDPGIYTSPDPETNWVGRADADLIEIFGSEPPALETDSGNLTASIEAETYPLDTKRIMITVRATMPGRTFCFYGSAALEYKTADWWLRLWVAAQEPLSFRWYYARDVDENGCYYTEGVYGDVGAVRFFYTHDGKKYLMHEDWPITELVPGEYRWVVFAGTEKLYVPFTFVE